jgi:hypothetical protein
VERPERALERKRIDSFVAEIHRGMPSIRPSQSKPPSLSEAPPWRAWWTRVWFSGVNSVLLELGGAVQAHARPVPPSPTPTLRGEIWFVPFPSVPPGKPDMPSWSLLPIEGTIHLRADTVSCASSEEQIVLIIRFSCCGGIFEQRLSSRPVEDRPARARTSLLELLITPSLATGFKSETPGGAQLGCKRTSVPRFSFIR